MNKTRISAIILAVLCTAMPLNSSASGIDYQVEPTSKKASVSGFSLSAPQFRYGNSSGKGGIELVPRIGGISADSSSFRSGYEFPEYFDMRDEYNVSPVKDQGGYGTCWAHSAMASAESSIIASDPFIDLSELHTAYYTFYGDEQAPLNAEGEEILHNGGTIYYAANLLSQWIGPVNESRLPYYDIDFINDSARVESLKYQSDYHLKNAYFFDYDSERSDSESVNNTIKQFVYNGLAVDISFKSDDDKYYSEEFNSARSERKPKFSNHSVVIVGWSDSFPKENFILPAENNGAWLVKNSWGTDIYDEGYMWISYDDKSLCEFSVFEVEDADKYAYNYHHDTFVPVQSMSASENPEEDAPSYMANIFTADETMQIEAISMFVPNCGTDYEITIYSGLTNPNDPVSGKASSVTIGTADISGNINVELNEDVIVNAGEKFSAVVKLYCPENPYVVPIESVLYLNSDISDEIESLGTYTTYDGIKSNTNAGQSFYSADGINWLDTTDGDYTYTDEEKEIVLEQLKYELFDGIYPEETDLLENAENLYNYYEMAFAVNDLSISIGNISLKALGNPVNTVDFSHNSGYIAKNEQIELSVKNGADIYYSINGGEYQKYTKPVRLSGYGCISATTDFKAYADRSYIASDLIIEIGDVNADGIVDATDASAVLVHYSSVSTGGDGFLKKAIFDYSDFNGDSLIDSADASGILKLYAERATN